MLCDVASPPAQHGLDPFGPLATAQARLVRHRERAVRRRGEDRREAALAYLLQQRGRHILPQHVVVGAPLPDVHLHCDGAARPQRARQRAVGRARPREDHKHRACLQGPAARPRALRPARVACRGGLAEAPLGA
eukprot:5604954-Pleurochrysis_carterae.AAC.1